MKHKIVLLSVILGFALSPTAGMASEHDSGEMKPEVKKEVKPKAKKKMKQHSHMEEKAGIPAKAADEHMPEAKETPGADKKQHLHPRDMK